MSREDFLCLRCGRKPLYRKIDGQTYYFCTCGERALTGADRVRALRARRKAQSLFDENGKSCDETPMENDLQKTLQNVTETQASMVTEMKRLCNEIVTLSLYIREKKDSLSLSLSQECESVGSAASFPPSAEREREVSLNISEIPDHAKFSPLEMAPLIDVVMENPGYAASIRKNPRIVNEWYYQIADTPMEYLMQGVRELQKNGWKFQPPGREKFRPLPDELGRAIKQEAVWKYKAAQQSDQKRESEACS